LTNLNRNERIKNVNITIIHFYSVKF
jgi:hypothetical protein